MISAPPTAVRTRRYLRVPTAARPSGRTALAPLVLALVIGILGMHALASHGAPAAPTAASSSVMGMAAMTGMRSAPSPAMTSGDSHESHDRAAAAGQLSAAPAAGVDSGSGHDMASVLMLCVVMLAAAALTLLVLLAVRVLRPLLPAAFEPAAVRKRTLQWVRGTGPPHEWQFSVIRC